MEKHIKTRIIYKHATESEWLQSEFVPLQGELIIYDIDENHPYQRFKIGDGVSTVNHLTTIVDNPLFVGTTEEYETAYTNGLIKDGMIVCITDDE